MAKWCDDKQGLITWSAAMAMIGVTKSKPLQARVAALIAKSDDVYAENKPVLKDLVQTATTLAQAQGRADFGTAIHEFSELLDADTLDWSYVPENLKGPLEAYQEATAELTVVDSEVFVAVDEEYEGHEVRGAGSLDRLYLHNDLGVVVGDLKTGAQEPKYPLGVTAQVAIYSRGQRYRDAHFEGSPPFGDGSPNADKSAWRKPLHAHLNQSNGVLVHCPLAPSRGKYRCHLYLLDLQRGWDNVVLGHRVQSARRPPTLERLS